MLGCVKMPVTVRCWPRKLLVYFARNALCHGSIWRLKALRLLTPALGGDTLLNRQ
jgi:hypothetical protein